MKNTIQLADIGNTTNHAGDCADCAYRVECNTAYMAGQFRKCKGFAQAPNMAAMLDEMTNNNAHQLRRIIEQYNISHKDAQILLNYSEGRGPFDNGEATA